MTEQELRDAIAAATGQFGPIVEMGYETIVLTSPLIISNRFDFELNGKGKSSTHLRYEGDPNLPAVVLEHCMTSKLRGFYVTGNCSAGIAITTKDGAQFPISSQNEVHDVEVREGAQTGFFVDSTAYDANNEFHRFVHCTAWQCPVAGFRIWGSQAHKILFERCSIQECAKGVWGQHGNYWSWLNGSGWSNDVDFYLGSFWVSVIIDGHRSENSNVFVFADAGWSDLLTSIKNVTWDGVPQVNRSAIHIPTNGPVQLENVYLQSNNGNPMRIVITDHDYGSVTLNGVIFNYSNIPNNDAPQRPVIVDQQIDLHEMGVWNRFINQGIFSYQPVTIRSQDHAIGRTVIPFSSTEINSNTVDIGWPLPLSNPANQLRSFSLAFDVVVDGGFYNTGFVRIDNTSCGLKTWDQLYLHLSNANVDAVPVTVVPGQKYRVVWAWDRDYGRVSMILNGAYVSAPLSIPLSPDNASLILGDEPVYGANWSGTISPEFAVWDRALSEEEMRQEAPLDSGADYLRLR